MVKSRIGCTVPRNRWNTCVQLEQLEHNIVLKKLTLLIVSLVGLVLQILA